MIPEGVHKIRVPLTGSPLGWVNSYVIRTDEGYALVDCGWDMPDALAALRKGLDELSIPLESIRRLIITHNHPDHYGLAGRLVQLASCGVMMHRLDAIHIESRYVNMTALQAEMEQWLRIHGAPAGELIAMVKGSEAILERVNIAKPDIEVSGGEKIAAGALEWEVIWTPGHSVGHICLYESTRKAFLSGDHILNPISPSIGLHAQSMGNPLSDYLSSLEAIRERDVEVVLPAHGDEFRGFRERIDELMSHHEARLEEICEIISRQGPRTAYETASQMRWRSEGGFEEWPPFQRRMATTEALAHLELLVSRSAVRRVIADGGLVRYALPS
ncbi:MAG TPA: MBL fold metallo-hydrolase [Dehalococcoidia bacterium]|jgi:glyoxylase-like metal-dependent hydrolase (beta-lactamase superfamily II)